MAWIITWMATSFGKHFWKIYSVKIALLLKQMVYDYNEYFKKIITKIGYIERNGNTKHLMHAFGQ